MNRVFGIVGWKNSGKTTLVSSLVSEFVARGLSVSTIKNAHHSFSVDLPGTDSYKHREAGAHEVALVSSQRWVLMHEIKTSGEQPTLETMVDKIAPCDLILAEGFKSSKVDKIECIRAGTATEPPIWKNNENIIALATDRRDDDCTKPQFDLNDIPAIADFIIQRIGITV